MSYETLDELLDDYFHKSYEVDAEHSRRGGYAVYVPRPELVARYEGDPVRSIEVPDDPDAHVMVFTNDDGYTYHSVFRDDVVNELDVFKLVRIY